MIACISFQSELAGLVLLGRRRGVWPSARDGRLARSRVEARRAHRTVRPSRVGGEEAGFSDVVLDGADAHASTRDLVASQASANVRAEGVREGGRAR